MKAYSCLGMKIAKVMENEEKCKQLTSFLKKSIIRNRQEIDNLNVIDWSTLETVEVNKKCFENIQIVKPLNSSSYLEVGNNSLNNLSMNINPCKSSNSALKSREIYEISEESEFIADKHCKEKTEYESSNLYGQNNENADELGLIEKQTVEFNQIPEDEYFELNIINLAITASEQQNESNIQSHHVKIFSFSSSLQSQPQHHQAFNLSNFSSFNAIHSNSNLNSEKLKAQTDFYQKQFIYLIKKIEIVEGKKLSQKGIEKLATQLHSLLPRQSLAQISLNKSQKNKETSKSKPKRSIPKLIFSKKAKQENNDKLHSELNTDKKVKYQTNIESELKSKTKTKTQLQINSKAKLQSNKQNVKAEFQSQKKKQKKDSDRSTSPLSYRILMEKKKNQKQKSQQRKNKFQATKNTKTSTDETNISSNISNYSFTMSHTQSKFDQSFILQKEKNLNANMDKKNRLKIIVENSTQGKTKTLSFEFVGTAVNMQKEVQNYCVKNKIQSKNIKPICEALSQQKPIITLKQ